MNEEHLETLRELADRGQQAALDGEETLDIWLHIGEEIETLINSITRDATIHAGQGDDA